MLVVALILDSLLGGKSPAAATEQLVIIFMFFVKDLTVITVAFLNFSAMSPKDWTVQPQAQESKGGVKVYVKPCSRLQKPFDLQIE